MKNMAFSIIGANGDVFALNRWTASNAAAVSVGISENNRTMVTTSQSASVYLVANGDDRDFKRLRTSHAFTVGKHRTLHISSQIKKAGEVRPSLVVLEYDREGNRLGEVSLKIDSTARVTLRRGTGAVLLAVRIVGRGSVEFSSLSATLTTEISKNQGPSVEYIEDDSAVAEVASGTILGAQERAAEISHSIKALSRELFSLASSPMQIETAEVTGSARTAEPISANRESMVREFLTAMARSLPETNGSHHYGKIPASVGIITDEYMFNFYRDVFSEAVYLSPDNYAQILAKKDLDAIFYVTCWKGMHGEEWKGVKFREKPQLALENILKYAESRGIPSVFQSIEDPPNFEYFLPIAEKFDFIFTSDAESVDSYRARLGHDRVFYGEYGANPMVNNPVGSFRFDLPKSFFAGSYPERYPERCLDMQTLFNSIPESQENLLVVDRNFELEGYDFPEMYQESIIGPFPHDLLQKIHKLFRHSLNFNSVKSSSTMCAMRVYELQAQGKSLISNYARSVFNKFPEVRIVAEQNTLSSLASTRLIHFERQLAQRAMHHVMHDKTSYEVVSKMAELVGLPTSVSRANGILVIADGNVTLVEDIVSKQLLVEASVVSQEAAAESLASGSYGYVTRMGDTSEYGPYYLAARVNAFKYADIDFVGQAACFVDGVYQNAEIHEFVAELSDLSTAMLSTEHADIGSFIAGDLESLRGRGYVVDPYEFDFGTYIDREFAVSAGENPELSVIVPVYNNGRYLETKCIPSLMRNRSWSQMEILLIDDGSTDDSTLDALTRLERMPNVRVERFGDGGSGSASRPRNRGIDIARGDLISFLDPDNEISEGGYDVLLDLYRKCAENEKPVDFASGYQVKVSHKNTITGRHALGADNFVKNPREVFFEAGKFPVVSTQAAVISRAFLNDNHLRYVERAAGQDTLFGWEVLARAKSVVFTDRAHLIYYAERDGSVTNSVDVRYFEKCMIMESAQVDSLRKLDLLDLYRQHHLDNFISNWYLKRLDLVPESVQSRARDILTEIVDLYERRLEDYEFQKSGKEQ